MYHPQRAPKRYQRAKRSRQLVVEPAGKNGRDPTRRRAAKALHLLTARQLQVAGDGDHSDGGGLALRVQPGRASWVFRYTAPAGKRREMGLGVARRGSLAQAGESGDRSA